MAGEVHDNTSNFYRLLLSLGDRSKARGVRSSGGSYGFGKAVYSSSSAIQTIFAYTCFKDENTGKARKRLFGCGYYPSHVFKKQHFGGRAWLGTKASKDKEGRQVVDPLTDADADRYATELGFERRSHEDFGTSILIIDSPVNLSEIVAGVEDWWWPRLIEDQLDVEALATNGTRVVPRPKRRPDLRPFIDAFDIARSRAEPVQGQQKYQRLNSVGDVELGVCGFTVVPLDEQGPVVPPERCNTVALIRSPLMVVAYKAFSETQPPVVGAYMASDDTDPFLKKSEPPAHDKWDPDSANLRDMSGEARKIVEAVLSRIRSNLKRFQSEAAPPPPPRPKRLSILERALASFFRPQGHGPGPRPQGEYAPIHLEFSRQPYPEAQPSGKLKLLSSFSVRLDDQAPEDDVDLNLRIGCPVVEDSGQEGDDLDVDVVCSGVKCSRSAEDRNLVRFKLRKGDVAKFSMESAEYDPAWTVRVRPEIDRETKQ